MKAFRAALALRQREGLTLETSAFQICHGGNWTFFISFDKATTFCTNEYMLLNPEATVRSLEIKLLSLCRFGIEDRFAIWTQSHAVVLLQSLFFFSFLARFSYFNCFGFLRDSKQYLQIPFSPLGTRRRKQ